MYQNQKSATTAGLLGIFLGGFGAHNWYLGEKGKGIAHVCMMSGGILIEIIAGVVLPTVLSWTALLTWATILSVLSGVAGLAMSASGIWGLIEGIILLSQGDAGLAAKGYAVATPTMPNYGPQAGYSQPGYPQPGFQQQAGPNMQQNYGPQQNFGMPQNMGQQQNMGFQPNVSQSGQQDNSGQGPNENMNAEMDGGENGQQ